MAQHPLSTLSRGAHTGTMRGWIVLLAVSLWPMSLRVGAAGLPLRPSVPRALLHADADGNRIYDDLETRLQRAEPATSVPVLVLFDQPLARLDLDGLRE